jgi:hypothetical protein
MSAILLKHLAIGVAAGSAFLAGVVPLQAANKHDYPETGTVISATTDHGDVYEIETGDKIYQMECSTASVFQPIPPQCDIAGKPIAVQDTVHFRIDDEDDEYVAYMPGSGNHEEKLRILSTELKVPPPLPATNPSAGESCAVLGTGMDLVELPYSANLSSPINFSSGVAATGSTSTVIPTGDGHSGYWWPSRAGNAHWWGQWQRRHRRAGNGRTTHHGHFSRAGFGCFHRRYSGTYRQWDCQPQFHGVDNSQRIRMGPFLARSNRWVRLQACLRVQGMLAQE